MAASGSSNGDVSERPVPAAAMEALFASHRVRLVRFVAGVVHDRDVAEDIVQKAFTKAVESGGTIPPDALTAWLYRVAFHEAVTWKRRSQVDRRAVQGVWHLRGGSAAEEPQEPLVRGETIDRVRQAMADLSPQQREVVLARVEGDKTFAQIAAELGLPLGTVLTHMRRALEKLRRKLKRHE